MKERSELIEWLRGEIVGPSRFLGEPTVITFREGVFSDSDPKRRGPLAWRSAGDEPPEEVLYYDREKPSRKYGVGLLHPVVASHLESGGEDHWLRPQPLQQTISASNLTSRMWKPSQ